ncbi:flavocytochrome c [Campylobacter curvus 525.92]|uniref:Flavocytochrome c n=2 Tax=Campylobacter curvus TaxID=200 RepID=A7GW83_CAMC5|nr:flavocytochrome c [Campylobacter curvus 525.92]
MMYDVIVIGSGLSGSVCALKCALSNLNVLVIEKLAHLGGTSSLSTLRMAVCGSKMQHKANIIDNEDIFLQDISKLTNGLNHINLTKKLVQNSKYGLDFLLQNGCEFKNEIMWQDGHSVPRTLIPKNGALSILSPLHNKLLNLKNCDILVQHQVLDVKLDHDMTITTIKNLKNGNIYEVKPNIAVVFATGGYARDKKFRTIQNPLTANIASKTSIGANADSLKILLGLNATPILLSQMRYAFDFPLEIIKYSIIVSRKNTKRFLNENIQRQELGFKILTDMNAKSSELFPIAIFDANGIDNFDNPDILYDLTSKNTLKKFESLGQIALHYDINARLLEKIVNIYNSDVKNGIDSEFSKQINDYEIKPLSSPPFFAMEVAPLLNYTQGGVMIDDHARVLDTDQKNIANIYAIGEAVGGVHGESRLISTSSTECVVFGLIAANDIINKKI